MFAKQSSNFIKKKRNINLLTITLLWGIEMQQWFPKELKKFHLFTFLKIGLLNFIAKK